MYQTYLITGATGFLGRAVLQLLLAHSCRVLALVMDKDPLAYTIPENVTVFCGDLTDKDTLRSFFAAGGDSFCVLHCAGIVSIASKPDEAIYRVNVQGTRNIVDLSREFGAGRLIYVSSVHAIPEKPAPETITEPDRFAPDEILGDYGKSKAMATALVLEAAQNGLNASVVLPSGIIGPGDLARGNMTRMLLERYDRLLSTILIGNNIVNIAAASIGTVLFVKHYGDAGATISTVVVTVVVLIFGEISPKSIAKDCAETWAMFSAPILQVLIWVFTPLNAVFSLWKKLLAKVFRLSSDNKMSQEELLMLVDEVQQDGSIDKNEGELLKNAIDFSEQRAEDILIHRTDLAALPITATKEEVAALFTETKYSRLLIYQDSIDNILGTIHQKDFYVGCGITDKPLREILLPPVYALEMEPISQLLKKLQQAKTHVAVVVDEYGGTCGIVTMEDILEELVGEIWDEHDEEETPITKLSADTYLVDAEMSFDDFADHFGLKSDSDMASVSGWVMEQFGRLPETGASFDFETLHVTITRIANHHIEQIRVVTAEAQPAESLPAS